MNLTCPNCQQTIQLKLPKPGQYKSKCKECSQSFRLIVSDREDVAPVIQKVKQQSVATQPALDETFVPTTVQQPMVSRATDREPPTQAAAPVPFGKQSGPAKSGKQRPVRSVVETAGRGRKDNINSGKTKTTRTPLPERLGGYRILDELGHGAMGAVYRAHQISLDREVALKMILARWAREPRMIARFTREAYAAAQISHHNVVQIYDLGCDHGTYFFAMEFVQGKPLSDVVQQHGKLDPTMAVSYVLQAARGLQIAHSQGMVHRDVKPANLLLSDDGIVKVADLGLVKVLNADDVDINDISDVGSLAAAKADITLANVAMGTAAFMAPEQADNAAAVDHRADIYSLGCTLYVLLTGTTPFQGATALEVITKHKTEPIVRPEIVVSRIPKELSEIVMRMVTRRPLDRPDNMGQVIEDLEGFLGVSSSGTFSPSEEHAATLERAVGEFNQAPKARIRLMIGPGFPIGCLVLGILSFLISPWMGTSAVGCGILTSLFYFVISGAKERTDLFSHVRELVALSSWTDRLTWLGGFILLLAIGSVTGMLGIGIAVTVASAGLALAFYLVFDGRLAKERAASIKTVEDLLRSMRLRGLEESDLRRFVARYSGHDWEEFYEALFGYRAKLDAHHEIERGEAGKRRRRFRPWRDYIYEFISARIKSQHEHKEQQHLQQVEQDDLKAQGVSPEDAMAQAKQIAAAMVRQALDSQELAQEKTLAYIDPAIAMEQKRQRIRKMLAEARNSKPAQRDLRQVLQSFISPRFGSRMRFVAGCVLVTGCLLWVRQNGLISSEDLKAATNKALALGDVSQIQDSIRIDEAAKTVPLKLPVIGGFFDSFMPGIAGLLLLVSAFVSGTRMSVFALPAAAIVLFGPQLGMPGIAAIGGAQTTSAVIGLGLIVAGFLFARSDA